MNFLVTVAVLEYVAVSVVIARQFFRLEAIANGKDAAGPVGLWLFCGLVWPIWIPVYLLAVVVERVVGETFRD